MTKRRPRGTGHLYQRKKTTADGSVHILPTWWMAYRVGGKLIRKSTGTAAPKAAQAKLTELLAAVGSGQVTAASHETTLRDLGALVVADYQNNGRKTTREVKRSFARLGEHFGLDRLAQDIDAGDIEGFKSKRKGQGKANATINRELAALKRGFRLAVRFKRLTQRPDFSLLTEDNARQGFFEVEQFEAVRKQLAAWLRPIVTFMFWTGWRKSEVLRLEWRQVDRKAGIIRIETSKNKSQRTIPYGVLPALKDVIEAQWKASEALRKKGTLVPSVFHHDGRRIRSFLTGWHAACARAGLAGRIPHDFRRSAARNMIRAGIPQRVAMEIGGWKTDSVFRRYAITDVKVVAENLKKLANLP